MMTIKLWDGEIPYFKEDADTPNALHFYPVPTWHPLPVVVVYPGGGYSHRAAHEGAAIAEYYHAQGFHACVVDYRIRPNRYPAPLADAQRAVKLVRAHAAEWHVDPTRVYTIGFSAGSHLAAYEALSEDVALCGDEIDREDCVPNGVILSYPMLSPATLDGISVRGGFTNIIPDGSGMREEDFIPENLITPNAPPFFIWITSGDRVCAPTYALNFAARLCECRVLNEFHMFPGGNHGLGLALAEPAISQWAPLSVDWIKREGKQK